MTNILLLNDNIDNILDNEGINKFLSAKEAIYAYNSSLGILKIRNIAEEVLNTLLEFIEYDYPKEIIDYINNHFKINKLNVDSFNSTLYATLKKIDNDGILLLNIIPETVINLDELKRLYRKAVFINHPDHGGNTENMQKLNNAFEKYHGYILSNTYNNFDLSDNETASVFVEYRFKSYLILSYIFGDMCAADKSYNYLIEAEKISKDIPNLFIGEIFNMINSIGNWIDRPIFALCNCKMEKEALIAEKILYKYWTFSCEFQYQNWLKTENESTATLKKWYKENLEVGKDYFLYNPKNVVIKTRAQADNLLRLGIIQNKRFYESIKRIERNEEIEKNNIEMINTFIHNGGFYSINLIKEDDLGTKIIHSPSYIQDRYALLDDSQKAQYFALFNCKNKNGELFEKYYRIRVNELLYFMINNYNIIHKDKLLNECNYFINNFKSKYDLYTKIKIIYEYLSSLNNNELDTKLSLLIAMDDPYRKYNYFDNTKTIAGEHKKRIEASDNYIEFIKLSNENIENYKNTGKLPDIKLDYDHWLKEKEKFEDLTENNQLAKKYNEVIFSNNPVPELVISVVEPYIEYLLSNANKYLEKKAFYANVSDFQIGYGLNKLTAAYVKIKNWEKVIYWIELFFSLPELYRERSSISEQDKLKKRLKRAKTMV